MTKKTKMTKMTTTSTMIDVHYVGLRLSGGNPGSLIMIKFLQIVLLILLTLCVVGYAVSAWYGIWIRDLPRTILGIVGGIGSSIGLIIYLSV